MVVKGLDSWLSKPINVHTPGYLTNITPQPAEHDLLFNEAIRFSEAQFRAQMMGLRKAWGKISY